MSSSPPAPATENDAVMEETVDGEGPRPGHAPEFDGTAVVEAAAAANHNVSSPHDEANNLNDGPDAIAAADDMDDDVGDVDEEFDEGGKFSESAEVQATVEALWRKVVAVQEKSQAGHACSVCMETLTCEGAHRICCIPCGHVYGRSCLESWLRRHGNETARCPRCRMMFADNHIIDLYAPANLWEGCGRLQEVKVYVTKAMAEVVVRCEGEMKATSAQARSEIAKLKADHSSSYQPAYEGMKKLNELLVQTVNERRELTQRLSAAVEKARARMNYIIDVKCAEIDMIKQHVAAAKQTERKEEDAPVQDSQARRIIKPNKRF